MVLFKELYVVLLFPCAQIDFNYPMWPIVLGQLNLPRKIRQRSANKSSACWNYPKLDTERSLKISTHFLKSSCKP